MDAVTLYTYKPIYKITRWSPLLFYCFLIFVFTQMYGEYSNLLMSAFIPTVILAMFILMPFLMILAELKESPRRVEFGTQTVLIDRFLFPLLKIDYGDVVYEKGIRLRMGKFTLYPAKFKNQVELVTIIDNLGRKNLIATAGKAKGKALWAKALLVVAGFVLFFVLIFVVPSVYDLILFAIFIFLVEVFEAVSVVRGFLNK